MPVIGEHTINEICIFEVDADPSTLGGIAAKLGSLSCLSVGAKGRFYKKIGQADTDWFEITDKILHINLISNVLLLDGITATIPFNDEEFNTDNYYTHALGEVTFNHTDEIKVSYVGNYFAVDDDVVIDSWLELDVGAGFIEVPKSRVKKFARDRLPPNSGVIATIIKPINIASTNKLRVRALITDNGGLSDVNIFANFTRLTLERSFK